MWLLQLLQKGPVGHREAKQTAHAGLTAAAAAAVVSMLGCWRCVRAAAVIGLWENGECPQAGAVRAELDPAAAAAAAADNFMKK
jgi:hypothetical protein